MEEYNSENDSQKEIFPKGEDNENNYSPEENLNPELLNQEANGQKIESSKEANKFINSSKEYKKIRKFPSKEVKIPKKIIHNQKKNKKE